MNRRTATGLIMLGGTGFLFGCRQHALAPSASRLAPLDMVVSNNGTSAPPNFHGYADAGDNLIRTMRNFGLNPEPIPAGSLGVGSYRLSAPSEFGWIFAVQNVVFGSDATNIMLAQDQLWAAYRKLSLG